MQIFFPGQIVRAAGSTKNFEVVGHIFELVQVKCFETGEELFYENHQLRLQ